MLLFKKNPRKGWRQVKSKRKHIMGDILEEAMPIPTRETKNAHFLI